mgnify:FL=1
MNKIKIWIGTFEGTNEEFQSYFDEDNHCLFCKDINEEEYDPDFIGIIPLFDSVLDVEFLAKETPLGAKNRTLLVEKCKEMGIYQGNAVFFYSGDTRDIVEGEIFNQLVYVGQYDL